MTTDTTFFNNEDGNKLLDRFKVSLKNNTQFFDILVGYFRASGFFQLYKELEEVEKIRVLVGLDVDQTVMDMVHGKVSKKSTKEIINTYSEGIKKEMELSEDSYESELGIQKFIEFIKKGKLEIRVFPKGNIHAKLYIIRKNQEKDPEHYGSVITGSSNFSLNGLKGNLEFNVELKNKSDVDGALERFNSLREDGVDVGNEFVSTINTDTFMNDGITPYELYLKFLYEYFGNLINQDKIDLELSDLPKWYTKLEYQTDAVKEILQKLDTYGGVFLADVVGLGKTIVSCLLLKYLRNKKALIICPPSIKSQWEKDLFDFNIGGCRVESLGMLHQLIKEGTEQYEYVFIDEAHRFRNEKTGAYDYLLDICHGKKVILVSATPFNNRFDDLKNLINLFHPENLPGISNVDSRFNHWNKQMKEVNIDEDRDKYMKMLQTTSTEMRERILKHLMVRRTRGDIKQYYYNDIDIQHLVFPTPEKPKQIIYEFDENLDELFNETIQVLKDLTYARYNPVRYLDPRASFSVKEIQTQTLSQKNITGFMKVGLVKRLESSFYAFKKSISRIKESYEKFLNMYENGDVYISKKFDIYDLLENNFERILEELKKDDPGVVVYKKEDLTKEYNGHTLYEDLKGDLEILTNLCEKREDIIYDPKVDKLVSLISHDDNLNEDPIIIFSESKDTVEYLKNELSMRLGLSNKEVYGFSGSGSDDSRNFIRRNLDPNSETPENIIKILITTDVLSEGINLHKSNVIINYDIPWNPTRVLQRFGRVNRVGTNFDKIYIYNFFPTSQGDEHLSLEKNVIAKMDAFLSLLGGDAQHLTEDVEINSKTLFEKLNSKNYYDNEGDEISDNITLGYLKELRDIRDTQPELFKKIVNLPKKTRSGKVDEKYKNYLLTFFRKGDFLKIYLSEPGFPRHCTFEEAADILKCSPDTPRANFDLQLFYHLLSDNLSEFNTTIFNDEKIGMTKGGGGDKTKTIVIKSIKGLLQLPIPEQQKEFYENIIKLIEQNIVSIRTVKEIKEKINKIDFLENSTDLYYAIKGIIPDKFINSLKGKITNVDDESIQVILSEYLI